VTTAQHTRRTTSVTAIPDALADVALIDINTLAAAMGCSPSHARDLLNEDEEAPEALRWGPRCTRFRLVDVREWLRKRAERGAADVHSAALVTRRAKVASDAAQAKRQAIRESVCER
jgi:predicted DNA-binding transcriptional regulator AlpA